MPLHNPIWEIIESWLVRAGLHTASDPTYGRWATPIGSIHYPELRDDPEITHTFRRVFLRPYTDFTTYQEAYDSTAIIHSEEVHLTPEELKTGIEKGGRWVFYSTWEMTEPSGGWEGGGRGRGRDLVMMHGLSDYGLRYSPHIKHFLKAGFRVIIPDLPSYGYSTGINSYVPSLLLLPAALHAVLTNVVSVDLGAGREQRKVFLSGASMGGWTVLYYLLKYPPSSSSTKIAALESHDDIPPPQPGTGEGYANAERPLEAEKARLQIAGAFVLCPMVEVSKSSRPWLITELIGRGLKVIAGTLPLAKALRGKVSDDPRVEEEFFEDALGYHGWLRVGTGLALLQGMLELDKRAEEIDVPIRLVHGSSDRVTSHLGTLRLFDRLPNEDKEVEIYDGYEHIMAKVGRDEEDDLKRQRVLADWRNWLLKRC